jgi:two-component system chemotaxis response regulator CheB
MMMHGNYLTSLFVAIGASGSEGLSDISELLKHWPINSRAIALVVVHRASDQESYLRELLQGKSRLPIIIAKEGEKLLPGACYIGEPAAALTLREDGHACLVSAGGNRLRNRTVDELFISVASHAKQRAIGVILSGSLDDGSRGMAAIHHAGGLTLVLDPGAKARGMQQNAIDFDGPISFVGTASQIAIVIAEAAVRRPREIFLP